jgi:hypothetical protein
VQRKFERIARFFWDDVKWQEDGMTMFHSAVTRTDKGGLKRSVHQLLLLVSFRAPLPEF